jgi:hypothetical protein
MKSLKVTGGQEKYAAWRLKRDVLFINQNCPQGTKFSSSENRIKQGGISVKCPFIVY